MAERKRVLLLTVPLGGHFAHMLRLAEWFLRRPGDYEVHVGGTAGALSRLPEGTHLHIMPEQDASVYEEVTLSAFAAAALGRDELDSQARMMELVGSRVVDAWVGLNAFGFATVRATKPHVVVCDHDYTIGDFLRTVCHSEGAALVVVNSAGRRVQTSAYNTVLMFVKHFRVMLKGLQLVRVFYRLKNLVGLPVAASDQLVTLFPSAKQFVDDPLQSNEVYTGPFMPLAADPGEAIPSQQAMDVSALGQMVLPPRVSEVPGLGPWLLDDKDDSPLVFIAFGTVAKPTPELVARLVEALDGGPWRILWALPEAHQVLLPPERQLSSQWRIEGAFGFQLALLSSGLVHAFVSHCGSSSVHEALSCGVPLVCMPFFGDQFDWAAAVCAREAGVMVDKCSSSPEALCSAVMHVLGEAGFRRSAEASARKMEAVAAEQRRWLREAGGGGCAAALDGEAVGVAVAAEVIGARARGQDPFKVLPLPRPSRTRGHVARLCGGRAKWNDEVLSGREAEDDHLLCTPEEDSAV